MPLKSAVFCAVETRNSPTSWKRHESGKISSVGASQSCIEAENDARSFEIVSKCPYESESEIRRATRESAKPASWSRWRCDSSAKTTTAEMNAATLNGTETECAIRKPKIMRSVRRFHSAAQTTATQPVLTTAHATIASHA
eukprot:Amastigsp_a843971_15.p3 type:complete len:141 gc:universal Amastigsp_a843971_15:1004-582(-)